MLPAIQEVLSDPENIPDIPNASAEYLMVRCNYAYLQRTGVLDELRKAGYSEQYLLGFIDGLGSVPELCELMMNQRNSDEAEEGGVSNYSIV
ncbi:phage protein [Pseudomonas asplenii]|uniref:phage protein n=1 Tax=Pseudomonas asplenii TaxID=53407 RepID=UPI0009C1317F|nr:phage protein [Pseudomonas fuscovaginae]